MSVNTKKRKRVAHFGKKQNPQKESPLDEDNMTSILRNMDYLHTSEQNFLSYQRHAGISSLSTNDSRQSSDSIPRSKHKNFNSGKIHPLMKKCQRNFKHIEKNRCIPKPRAHVGHIPRPPRNPLLNKDLEGETKSSTFNSTQTESSLKLRESESSSTCKNRIADMKSRVIPDEEPIYYQSSSGSSDEEFEKFIIDMNRKSESNSSYSSDSDNQSKKKKLRTKTKAKSRKTVAHVKKRTSKVTRKVLTDSSDDETEIANANNLNSNSVAKSSEKAGVINDNEHFKSNILSDGSFAESPSNTIVHSDSSDSFDSAEYHSALQSSNRSDNEGISTAEDDTFNQTSQEKSHTNIRSSSFDDLSVDNFVKTLNKETVQVEDDCVIISDCRLSTEIQSFIVDSTKPSSSHLDNSKSLNRNSLQLDNSLIESPEDTFSPKILEIQSISRNEFLENVEKSNNSNKDRSNSSDSKEDCESDCDIEILQVNNYSDTRLIPPLTNCEKRKTMTENRDPLENLKKDILHTLSKIDFECIKQVINPSVIRPTDNEQLENTYGNSSTIKSKICNENFGESNKPSEKNFGDKKSSSDISNSLSDDKNKGCVREGSPDIIVCEVINRSRSMAEVPSCSSHKGKSSEGIKISLKTKTSEISNAALVTNSSEDLPEVYLNHLTEYLKEELNDSQKSVLPLLDLYKLEYEKYLSIVNTEHTVSTGLKLYEEQQQLKLLHLRSSIQKFMDIDPCYKKIFDKTDQLMSDCKTITHSGEGISVSRDNIVEESLLKVPPKKER